MTHAEFEIDFISRKTQPVVILVKSGCWLMPQIGTRVYRSVMACACDDIVLFAKQREHHKELYSMCDQHRIQPLGVLLRADGRSRSGRGGHRGA